MTVDVIKAHAYGNDFVFVPEDQVDAAAAPALARAACDRHRGVGADGLILYRSTASGAVMRLFNADGSEAEVSGNGVRCLGVILLRQGKPGDGTIIETAAGPKRLALLAAEGVRYTFRTSMGAPSGVAERTLALGGEMLRLVTLWMGNPQCVLLESTLDADRFHRLGPVLATHPIFPSGTNVAFVQVESPERLRILIWERGVGPTQSSGTGTCAAAVAAAAFGGASRRVIVEAPGGAQQVEWTAEDVLLTGWAELIFEGRWSR